MVLPIHPGLADSSRLKLLTQQGESVRGAEILMLVFAGVCAAAASVFFDLSLKIPGHAIIRAVFPMAFGLAIAPRRMAGTVMGAGALGSALVFKVGGFGAIGVGALTSLTLTGPMLDLALWHARRGWWLYLGFAMAGVGSNLAALMVRAGIKLAGLDHVRGRPLFAWLPQAIGTYVLCGAIAGLISALVWFQFARRDPKVPATEAGE
jgi:hypothetical protein